MASELTKLLNEKMEKIQTLKEVLRLSGCDLNEIMTIEIPLAEKYLNQANAEAWNAYANAYITQLELLAKRYVK